MDKLTISTKVREDVAQICANYYDSLPQLSQAGVVTVDGVASALDNSKPVVAVLPTHIKKNQEETKRLLNTLLKKIQTEKLSSFQDIQTKDPEMLRPFISHGVTSQGVLVTLCKLAYSEQRRQFVYLGIGSYNLLPPETSKSLAIYSQNLEKFFNDDSYRSEVFQCKNFDAISGSCMVPEEYYLLGVSQGLAVSELEGSSSKKEGHTTNRLSQNPTGSCTRRSHEQYYVMNMGDFEDISATFDQQVAPHFVTKSTRAISHPASPAAKPTKPTASKKSARSDHHLSGIDPTRKVISTLSIPEKHLIFGELAADLKGTSLASGADIMSKDKVRTIIDKMTSSPDVTMEDVFTVIGYGAFIALQ